MHSLSFVPLLSHKSVIHIEKKLSEDKGKFYLVKKAARSLYRSIINLDNKKLKKIKIFIGPGNNGVDGIFLSSLLIKSGYKVDMYLSKKSGVKHSEVINNLGLKNHIVSEKDLSCKQYSLVVDALFGTGLNKNIRGIFSKIIEEINASNSYVVSIDVPSGLDSETGKFFKKVVYSNLTCTLVSLKKGLFTKSGRDLWNRIDNYPLVNETFKTNNYLFSLTSLEKYKIKLSNHKRTISCRRINFNKSFDTHKSSLGKSLIIGGNDNFFGALLLSSQSALKTGSRYVEAISTEKHANLLPLHQPELIASSYSHSEFYKKLNEYENLLIGPGLGKTEWSKNIFSNFCKFLKSNRSPKNIILDADALNLLAQNPFKYDSWVLTPHPGEAARLLHIKTSDVQDNRLETANELQKKYGGIIVLKGSGTIIKTPDDNTFICLHGNQGMATAGMGDCLSGIILSTISLLHNKSDAVLFGTGIHSLSADLVANKKGTIGLLATDVIEQCSRLLNLKIKFK